MISMHCIDIDNPSGRKHRHYDLDLLESLAAVVAAAAAAVLRQLHR